MNQSQDPTLGSRASGSETPTRTAEKRARPENKHLSSGEAKSLQAYLMAAALQAEVGGPPTDINAIRAEAEKQIKEYTDEQAKQPHELHGFIIQRMREKEAYQRRIQQTELQQRRMSEEVTAGPSQQNSIDDKVSLQKQLSELQFRVNALQPELLEVQAKMASMETCFEAIKTEERPDDTNNARTQSVLKFAGKDPKGNGVYTFGSSALFQPLPQFSQLEDIPPPRVRIFTVPKDPNGPIQRLQRKLQAVTAERDANLLHLEEMADAKLLLHIFNSLLQKHIMEKNTTLLSVLAELSQLRVEAATLSLQNAKLTTQRNALLQARVRANPDTQTEVSIVFMASNNELRHLVAAAVGRPEESESSETEDEDESMEDGAGAGPQESRPMNQQ